MLQSLVPHATPVWLDITKTIAGPIIAAIVVVVGLIWRDRIERRNVAQLWFEQTYITDGIDVLVSHLNHSTFEIRESLLTQFDLPAVPTHVLWRIKTILPDVKFLFAFILLGNIVDSVKKNRQAYSDEDFRQLTSFARDLLSLAERVRLVLLDVRIRSKSDAYDLNTNSEIRELMAAEQAGVLDMNIQLALFHKFLRTSEVRSQPDSAI